MAIRHVFTTIVALFGMAQVEQVFMVVDEIMINERESASSIPINIEFPKTKSHGISIFQLGKFAIKQLPTHK